MRAAFIPALPPSALLAGMIAPSFRLVNRFCGKKLLRTCGRRERPPALCALFSRSPLACGRVPYPPYARCGMGRSLRRTEAARAFRAPIWRKKRGMFHPAPTAAGPPRPHQPSGGLEGSADPSKCIPNPSDMRGGFGSLAQARLPYAGRRPGEAGGKAAGEVGGRRTPGGKDRRQPSFFRRAHSSMQIIPPLPSLMILDSVSCTFSCASAGMRHELVAQALAHQLVQALAEEIGVPDALGIVFQTPPAGSAPAPRSAFRCPTTGLTSVSMSTRMRCRDGALAFSRTPKRLPCLTISGSCKVSSFIVGVTRPVARLAHALERVGHVGRIRSWLPPAPSSGAKDARRRGSPCRTPRPARG